MFSVNIRAKSSCDILKSVGISRGIGIFSAQPGLKAIRKAKICTAYAPAAREILTNCPLREVVEEDFF